MSFELKTNCFQFKIQNLKFITSVLCVLCGNIKSSKHERISKPGTLTVRGNHKLGKIRSTPGQPNINKGFLIETVYEKSGE
jgi:hypothetical protein